MCVYVHACVHVIVHVHASVTAKNWLREIQYFFLQLKTHKKKKRKKIPSAKNTHTHTFKNWAHLKNKTLNICKTAVNTTLWCYC